jgi:hypothetical protein
MPLPQGYTLDQPQQPATAQPHLPPGYTLDPIPPPDPHQGMTHQPVQLPGGRMQGVDYTTGTGFFDRMALNQASNPAEQKLYLEKKYGADKVHQDPGGRFYIMTPDTKMVAPSGGSPFQQFSAAMADPTMVGGTLGGVAGSAIPGVGTAGGAVAGAMAGGALGRTVSEAWKSLVGTSASTAGEKAHEIGSAGLAMGGGEGAGRLISGIPSAAGSVFRSKVAGVTPESRQMAATIERMGGVAPIQTAAPGLASPSQKQFISAKLGEDWLAQRNTPVVQKRLQDIIRSSSLSPVERENLIRQMLDPAAAVSTTETGEPLVQAVRSKVAGMEANVSRLTADADRILNSQLSSITRRMAKPGSLGQDVAADLATSRQQFSEAAQKLYGPIDNIVGDQAVVPTAGIKKQATELLQSPLFGDPRLVPVMTNLSKLPDHIKFSDAQEIRTLLNNWELSPDLAGSLPKRQFSLLRDASDAAFTAAADNPAIAPAIDMLRKADAFYAEGIKKFKNVTINQIVHDVRDGIVPNPVVVANKVLREGQLEQAQTIKGMVQPSVWERIAGADWESIVGHGGSARDPQSGDIIPRRLAAEVADRKASGLLDLTYGSRARDIELYADRVSARGGKLPPEALGLDRLGRTVRELDVSQKRLDDYLKTNYLAALAKPGPVSDDAVRFVVKPGQTERLEMARAEFGDSSPQMKAIRTQALKELLHSAVARSPTGVGQAISGTGIERALSQYTTRQQEILFPGGLAEDMRQLAREIRGMFPGMARGDMLTGAQIAGAIKNAPLLGSMRAARAGAITGAVLGGLPGFAAGPGGAMIGAGAGATVGAIAGGLAGGRLVKTQYYQALAWIYSQPRVVRMLTQGLQPGPGKAVTREVIRGIFRLAGYGMLPDVQEQDPALGSYQRAASARTWSSPFSNPLLPPLPPMRDRLGIGDRGPQGGTVTGVTPVPPT